MTFHKSDLSAVQDPLCRQQATRPPISPSSPLLYFAMWNPSRLLNVATFIDTARCQRPPRTTVTGSEGGFQCSAVTVCVRLYELMPCKRAHSIFWVCDFVCPDSGSITLSLVSVWREKSQQGETSLGLIFSSFHFVVSYPARVCVCVCVISYLVLKH